MDREQVMGGFINAISLSMWVKKDAVRYFSDDPTWRRYASLYIPHGLYIEKKHLIKKDSKVSLAVL